MKHKAKALAKQQTEDELKNTLYLSQAKTNPLLKLYPELKEYYRTAGNLFKLVAVIPALPENDPKSQSYYASGHLSAVFIYTNPPSDQWTPHNHILSNSEWSKLYKRNPKTKNYSNQDTYEQTIQYLNSHPTCLFFKGCDDGHILMRFPSEEKAMEFLSMLEVFEDIFEFKDMLQYEN